MGNKIKIIIVFFLSIVWIVVSVSLLFFYKIGFVVTPKHSEFFFHNFLPPTLITVFKKNVHFDDSRFSAKDYAVLIIEPGLVDSMNVISLHVFKSDETYSASFKYLGKTGKDSTDSISFWNDAICSNSPIDYDKIKYLHGYRIATGSVTDGTDYFISYGNRHLYFDSPEFYRFSPYDVLLSKYILHLECHEQFSR